MHGVAEMENFLYITCPMPTSEKQTAPFALVATFRPTACDNDTTNNNNTAALDNKYYLAPPPPMGIQFILVKGQGGRGPDRTMRVS